MIKLLAFVRQIGHSRRKPSDMEGIDINLFYHYRNQDYVRRSYDSVCLTNALIARQDAVDFSMEYVACLLNKWKSGGERRSIIDENDVHRYKKEFSEKERGVIEPYDLESITFWLSYCLGYACRNWNAKDVLPILRRMYYSIEGAGFANSYAPDDEVVLELSSVVDCSLERVLMRARVSQTREDAEAYIKWFNDLSVIKKKEIALRESTYQTFTPLPDDCYLVSGRLLKNKLYARWIELFHQLLIPEFQVQWCMPVHDPNVYPDIIKTLDSAKLGDAEKNRYRILLLNEWYNCKIRSVEAAFSPAGESTRFYEADKIWAAASEKVKEELETTILKDLQQFKESVPDDLLAEVFFSKVIRSTVRNQRNDVTREVLSLVQGKVSAIVNVNVLSTDINDINYLSYLSSIYVRESVDKEKGEKLLNAVQKWIASEQYFPLSLDEPSLTVLRHIALLCVTYGPDVLSAWIREFEVRFEGVNSHWMNKWNKKVSQESIVIFIALLTLELDTIAQEGKTTWFKKVANYLLVQCHCCGMDLYVRDNYKWSLILAELIADQILPSEKAWYEEALVKKVYEKDIVLMVLANARQPIADSTLAILRDYRDKDWPVKKMKLANRHGAEEIKWTEKMFMTLL